ncbi:MAG: hypothetical protein WKF88_08885 [Ferruginibacter sp.]
MIKFNTAVLFCALMSPLLTSAQTGYTNFTRMAEMVVDNADLNITTEQKNDPSAIELRNIPGLAAVTLRWIVQGTGKYTVTVDSRKGGTASKAK